MRHFLLILVLLACIGCGSSEKPKLVPVIGSVSFESNALTAGNIYFHPSSENSYQKDKPSSVLQLDGSFTIKTFPFGDGVPPGTYKVTLAPELANRIKKPDYANPAKTPWQVEVPDTGLTDLKLEVK